MKKTYKAIKNLAMGILLSTVSVGSAFACNLSSFNTISIVPSGGNVTITAQLCVGYGLTGAIPGGDGDTFDIAFGFYGPGGGPVNILSYAPGLTPPFLTSTFTGCEMPGIDVGPVPGDPFYTQATLYYFWDPFSFPSCGPGFACVYSTVLCGNEASDCFTFTFTTDVLPDSIRAFGVEGAGNPVAGCYPNPDMLLTFVTLPVVWGDIEGYSTKVGNELKWFTHVETNNDRFEVLRSVEGGEFEVVGTVLSKGDGKLKRDYTFLDRNPNQVDNLYKVRQIDNTGESNESNTVSLGYTPPSGLAWLETGPNPTTDIFRGNFLSEKNRTMRLVVADTRGNVVVDRDIEAFTGSNNFELDMREFESGIYFIRLQGTDGKLDYKLLKM